MSDFEIRDDMPLPPYTGGRRGTKFPLRDMRVGQYIKVEWSKKSFLGKKVREFLAANAGWEFEGRALEEKKSYGFWCMKRPDAPASAPTPTSAPKRSKFVSEFESKRAAGELDPATQSAPTAHQQRLREAAKLQPIGKRQAHVVK